jgi:hypothetical protein
MLEYPFMQPTDQLQVDVMSVEDIRAKLPEARRIFKAKQEALEAMNRDVKNFGGLVVWMAHIAGEQIEGPWTPPSSGGVGTPAVVVTKRKDSPAQDRAIAGLKRADQPLGPTALYRFMKGEGLEVPTNANALGAALWNAAESGRIKKTPDGRYALLEWDTEQPELEVSDPATSGDADPAPNEAQVTPPGEES